MSKFERGAWVRGSPDDTLLWWWDPTSVGEGQQTLTQMDAVHVNRAQVSERANPHIKANSPKKYHQTTLTQCQSAYAMRLSLPEIRRRRAQQARISREHSSTSSYYIPPLPEPIAVDFDVEFDWEDEEESDTQKHRRMFEEGKYTATEREQLFGHMDPEDVPLKCTCATCVSAFFAFIP